MFTCSEFQFGKKGTHTVSPPSHRLESLALPNDFVPPLLHRLRQRPVQPLERRIREHLTPTSSLLHLQDPRIPRGRKHLVLPLLDSVFNQPTRFAYALML
jgi:hypothetical protein